MQDCLAFPAIFTKKGGQISVSPKIFDHYSESGLHFL